MTKGAFQSVQNLVFSNLTAKTPRFDVATAIPCPTGSARRKVGTLPKRSRQWACEQGRAPTRLPRVSRPPRRISGALHPVSLRRAVPIVMGTVTGPQTFSVHRDRAFRWRTFGFPITSPAPRGWLADAPALPADAPRPAQKRSLRLCRVHLLRAWPGGSGSAPLKALPRPCRDESARAHFPIGLSVQTGDTAPCHPHP